MAQEYESVKLPKDVIDIIRQIAEQTGRPLNEVLRRMALHYSETYLDGYSAGGRFFGKAESKVQ